jgi:hypothetical protein
MEIWYTPMAQSGTRDRGKVFMDTRAEHGSNFKGHSEEIIIVSPDTLDEYWPVIKALLMLQQPSWQQIYSIDSINAYLKQGELVALLLRRRDIYLALMLTSTHDYDLDGKLTVRIEFLTANHFHHTVKAYNIIEELARKNGFIAIEAVAHPAMAKYFAKKHGFRAPGVYIRKELRRERNN